MYRPGAMILLHSCHALDSQPHMLDSGLSLTGRFHGLAFFLSLSKGQN